ncbi:sugar transferase [Candidatus Neomarinimicrobiota bacterium]
MKKLKYTLLFLDLLIVVLTFGFFNYNKFVSILPKDIYLVLFIVHISVWLITSLYNDKYSAAIKSQFIIFIKSIIWSTTLALLFTISIIAITDLNNVSRLFIIKINIIPMFLELFIVGTVRLTIPNTKFKVHEMAKSAIRYNPVNINNKLMLGGALLLIFTYFFIVFIKTGDIYFYSWSEHILLLLFTSWLIALLLTNKYIINKTTNIYYHITPFVKSGIIMFLISAGFFYFFHAELLSRFLLFGTIISFTVCEILIQVLYFYYIKAEKSVDIDYIKSNVEGQFDLLQNIQKVSINKNIDQDTFNVDTNLISIINQISSLANKEKLITFLQDKLKNVEIKHASSTIISTSSIENIEILNDASRKLLINLHKVNDIRKLNRYLILCHNKIITGGFLVGYLLPLETVYTRLRSKMPKLMFTIFYPIHFLINRIIPKLPKINILYFIITKGINRSISKSELYGRLNFCGFTIISDQFIQERLYFIAKKVKTISSDENPSFKPIVKLDRIGLNKKLITIHKFRTMYPYSEYLQKDIYQDYKLDNSGKFNNDPRIPRWGKLMRKYWIDELPQLYDWLQGRLNLVGVRAISEHYFNLYPRDLQEYRTQFKPGILPPYYADLPNNLNEIFDSEWKYLKQKEKSPIKTDIKYAILIIKNIIFKGVRSK